MKKIFTFKGIKRDADVMYANDGDCMEMVNMRLKNGSTVPVPMPREVASLAYAYVSVYYHSMASAYMLVTEGDATVHVYDESFAPLGGESGKPSLLSEDCIGVKRIEFIGNLVCLFTDCATLYAVFDMGRYKWLGERPTMPRLTFTAESRIQKVITDDKYKTGNIVSGDEDKSLLWINAGIGYFDYCISALNNDGFYIDRVLFRYAFRLFDGSYVWASPIYYVDDEECLEGMSRDEGNFASNALEPDLSESKYNAKVQGFKPIFKFEPFDLKDWEDIIVSVDVFSSGSIMGHKVDKCYDTIIKQGDDVYISNSDGYDRYVRKSYLEIYNDVSDAKLFYKVAEYSLDGRLLDSLENVSQSSLALCTSFCDDSTSHVSRTAEYTYVFNGRLHIANLRETLFKGYDSHVYVPARMDSVAVDGYVCTELKTTNGVLVVKRDYGHEFIIGISDGVYYMQPYIMYPDSRAVKQTFVLTVNGCIYRRSFDLVAHNTLNHALYLHNSSNGYVVSIDDDGVSEGVVSILSDKNVMDFFSYKPGVYMLSYSSSGFWMYGDVPFVVNSEDKGTTVYYGTFRIRGTVSEGDVIIITIKKAAFEDSLSDLACIALDGNWEELSEYDYVEEISPVEMRKNVLKVSDTDNPLCFPAKQTYTPSNNDIVALCSNTVALSQGQFGQHPLYVFCADGIWAMQVDASGVIAYSNSYPVSREVCVNAASVKGIDSGVVFISSKGLMLLDGGNVALLSSALDSEEKSVQNFSESNIIYRIAAIASLQNILDDVTFREYSKNAILGYIYSERELLLSNPLYSYSYMLSLDDGTWSKYSHKFNGFANIYPDFMGLTLVNGCTVLSAMDDDMVGNRAVFLMSRPLLWGSKLHKRITQMLLHTSVKVADEDSDSFNGLACYILCSNDGVNFKPVAGHERRRSFCDMQFPYFPTSSYRYFAVALVGRIAMGSLITAIEFSVETAWDNRLY